MAYIVRWGRVEYEATEFRYNIRKRGTPKRRRVERRNAAGVLRPYHVTKGWR